MTSATPDLVAVLVAKGVRIGAPATVEIGPDVDPDRISGDGVVIHPGTRIRGARTVISAGCEIGREGPVTLEDCVLGPKVALKGGYASRSVFLEGSNLGLGHHVRDCTILEEQAGGAHTVGLKQTILFPFATLGSLINFCDAFLAGGTSRSDHAEVGSSYIHFNFTPRGDKTTPSMFGDVARGVMLRERPIFLGGQGGAVGPVTVAYGTVVGAGSILRRDVVEEDTMQVVAPPPNIARPFDATAYPRVLPLVAKNLRYIANLVALRAWYATARAPFFARQELGELVLDGALVALDGAMAERTARLRRLAGKLTPGEGQHDAVLAGLDDALAALASATPGPAPEALTTALTDAAARGLGYLDAIRALDDEQVSAGTGWLQGVVDAALDDAARSLPGVA